MRLLRRRLAPSFGADASIQSFGLASISWCRFGCELATGDGAIPKEGEQGPEEVAKRPSQVPNGSAARIGRTQAGTSTRGAEGAERASGCVATRPEARVGSGGFQLNVTH